jgi:hypothetical protein
MTCAKVRDVLSDMGYNFEGEETPRGGVSHFAITN